MSRTTYFNGLAAEEIAERQYLEAGGKTLARRYRSEAGEIDLIIELPDTLVFVEVKARKTLAGAAESISSKQWQRIMASAEIFVSEQAFPLTTDLRFDAALIDRTGNCEIVENAPVF